MNAKWVRLLAPMVDQERVVWSIKNCVKNTKKRKSKFSKKFQKLVHFINNRQSWKQVHMIIESLQKKEFDEFIVLITFFTCHQRSRHRTSMFFRIGFSVKFNVSWIVWSSILILSISESLSLHTSEGSEIDPASSSSTTTSALCHPCLV